MQEKSAKYIRPDKVLLYLTIMLGLWLMMILSAPALVQSGHNLLQAIGTAVYIFTDPVCHQLPDRSLFLGSLPFPVCARCLFIYAGGFLVLLYGYFRREPKYWSKIFYFGIALFVIAELIFEKVLAFQPLLELRIISGLITGILIFRLALESIFFTGEKISNE